jgi:hypothetical protein
LYYTSHYVTAPETTQTVPLLKKIVARPLVARVIVERSVLIPDTYAVVIEHVIVFDDELLLNIVITSPALNVEFGIVTPVPEVISTCSPISPVVKVYEPDVTGLPLDSGSVFTP